MSHAKFMLLSTSASFSPTHKVYNQIKECAATLCPLVQLDITIGSIPPAIIISLIMAIELSFSRRLLIPTCMFEEFTDQKLPIPDQSFEMWRILFSWDRLVSSIIVSSVNAQFKLDHCLFEDFLLELS